MPHFHNALVPQPLAQQPRLRHSQRAETRVLTLAGRFPMPDEKQPTHQRSMPPNHIGTGTNRVGPRSAA
jgi:hypothetical protein